MSRKKSKSRAPAGGEHDKSREGLEHELQKSAERIGHLEGQLKDRDEKLKAYVSDIQRLQADFENHLKRMGREREQQVRLANRELILELLDVVDNFDKAVEQSKKSSNSETLVKGIHGIHRQLHDILRAKGLQPIASLGKKFDVSLHEAVSTVDSGEEDTIVDEVQRGYLLHSQVIRPAKVVISKKQ
ncbi:MAG: nucleotide exchange factor GrpE [Candidatus Altiarchaeota archaeon]